MTAQELPAAAVAEVLSLLGEARLHHCRHRARGKLVPLPAADIKMPALLRRYHGEYTLPGMMLFNKSSKLAALRPN